MEEHGRRLPGLRAEVPARTKGNYKADVGIWVGGETPYAEGKGDSSTLAFGSDNSTALSDICFRVTKCIAILESGRPLVISDQLAKANAVTDEPINTGDGKTPLFAFGYGRTPY